MATALKLRRGTTTQHSTFTGAEGEVTVDTTKDTLVVHNGSTAGGVPLAKETGSTIAVAAGTVSAPGLTTSGDTNTGIFFPAADTIAFAEGGVEAMRIDSSGNCGIGTSSPSSYSSVGRNLVIAGSGDSGMTIKSGTTSTGYFLFSNAENSSSNNGVISYNQNTRQLDFTTYGASSFTTFGTNGSERMRIDSSGNVGIGTSSPGGYKLNVNGTSNFSGDVNLTSGSDLQWNGGDVAIENSSTNLIFKTFSGSLAERARITSGGYFKASPSGSYYDASTSHEFNMSVDNANNTIFRNTSSSGNIYGPYIYFSGQAPNNTTSYFLACGDNADTRCIIYSSGTVTNKTGTYNAFSDIKLKQDIVDANSQWDDIKNLRVRKFRLKDEVAADPNYPAYIGLVAQEAELVSPGLIDNCPDFEQVTNTREVEKTREVEVTPAVLDEEGNIIEAAVTATETYTETEEYTERVATGTVTKSVKYSILYMKAVKALQEAQLRIEALEAQNAAIQELKAELDAAKERIATLEAK